MTDRSHHVYTRVEPHVERMHEYDWTTIIAGGELVGGCDIILEMAAGGELKGALDGTA